MCHRLSLSKSVTQNVKILQYRQNDSGYHSDETWILGRKTMRYDDEDNSYYSTVMDTKYSYHKLPSGIVIGDPCFSLHEANVKCKKVTFCIKCLPGIYAYLDTKRVGKFFYVAKQRDFYVAARREWVSFISDDAFSAHTMICADSMRDLKRAIGEYRNNIEKFIDFRCNIVRRRNQLKCPVFGYDNDLYCAVRKAFCALLAYRPLHECERALLDETMDKSFKKFISLFNTSKGPFYVEAYSTLWISD